MTTSFNMLILTNLYNFPMQFCMTSDSFSIDSLGDNLGLSY